MQKKVFFPALLGNILEYYDFCLYGYFAVIIAKLFFPSANQTVSLIATFSVFVIGFLMRPLGAILFGHFGDRYGRKKMLATGIILMALSTALVGCLPTYAQLGPVASVLLIACRLIQGLAVGGEFSGSLIYMIEHAQPSRRGLCSSLGLFSANIGVLLASGVAMFINDYFTQAELYAGAWRIPFLFGIILGGVGLYFRLRMPETPIFLNLENSHAALKNPLATALKEKPLAIFKAVLLVALPAMASYIFFIYFPTYLNVYFKLPLHTALLINSLCLLINIITLPLVGMLSDKVGRKPILTIGALGFCILPFPLLSLLGSATLVTTIVVQCTFSLLISFAYGIVPAVLVEMFPTNIRYTAVALSFNLANSIFGGSASMVISFLIATTGSLLAPAYCLFIMSIPMLIVLWRTRETYKEALV